MNSLSTWITHHVRCLTDTVGRLVRSPLTTLLNALVIGAALALPLAGYSVVESGRSLAQRAAADARMGVFFAADTRRAEIEKIEARLRASPMVARVEFVSKEAGLESLKRHEGLAEVIATLKGNPLPDALTVHLQRSPPAEIEELAKSLRADARVAHVQLDSTWLARLDRLLAAGRVAVGILALLLGLAFVAITFNTVRMQIVTRRDEIDVSRLVGATSATIRRSFYYLGGLTGLLGAAVAWAIAWAALRALDHEVAELATLYASEFRLTALNPIAIGVVFVGAIALGLVSAWLAVSKYLLESRPR